MKKVIRRLIDDVDGREAKETITFSIDGVAYEIDLHEENAARIRAEAGRWIACARRKTPRRSGPARRDRAQAAVMREWARANGYRVSAKGRVPSSVEQAWQQAHGS